jgi:signal transduction histidine kinase/DNA-binding response OmpR family regulator
MKLQNVKIATQLRLGLGLIVALVVATGGFVWYQTHQIWLGTKTLYTHPLQIQDAVGALRFDILAMRLEFRNLLLAKDAQERLSALQNSDIHSADAKCQINNLRTWYLGSSSDVDAVEKAFVRWVAVRDSNRILAQDGKIAEAMGRVVDTGDIGVLREILNKSITKIDNLAAAKVDQLYQTSTEQSAATKRQLTTVVAVVVLLSLLIGGLLLKEIKTPLADLTAAAKQFRQGNLEVRSQHASANEFGILATAFNTMAEAIQEQTQLNDHAADIAEVMLRENEIHAFSREMLNGLMAHTGSQIGAVYFQNKHQTAFVHFESIGLGAGARHAFSATELEGEMGAVLATRRIQHLTDIPADTRFTFATVSGTFTPRAILTIPVLTGNAVVAVISLASVHAYSESALRLVDKVWSVLCARINGVLAIRKIQYFAEQLEDQNHELEDQQRKLAAQTAELTEQNTELEMQKHQLDEANRLKSAFLSNMSHELRTPLNSVIALSGVLNRRLANAIPPEEYGYLEVIERNGRNLLLLINNILDLSRIEAGREDVSLRRFSIHEWISETVAMLEPLAREKNIELINRVSDDLPLLTSDPEKCQHILQNLVGNAMKFTDAGYVEISARTVDGYLLVAVHDTGIGIASDQIHYIFDEFRQADDSTSRKYGGTGLGLAIARKYALLVGGDISVESTPGLGSTFILRLPLDTELPAANPAATSAQPFAPRTGAPSPATCGRPQRLLLVEDNAPAIIQLTDILHSQGYQVEVARDGKQALALIEQAVPDAMILDLMMPEVDGFQVLRTIRSVERTAQVPVLILSAKHVTRQELSFLTSNHIHQLILKGDINKEGLLASVAQMIAAGDTAAIRTPPLRRRPNRPGKALVLVVEDNPDNLRTACALLEPHYELITAADGHGGISQARLHQPDLILSDLALPGIDGYALLAELRHDPALCDIPVVAVTASAMKGNREQILANGFDGYISKPIDHTTLIHTLREFLNRDVD